MDTLINVENLRKSYFLGNDKNNEIKALDGVSFSVEKGDFVAIIGPSGSGKSTLLQILGLLDSPSSGRYQLAGQDVFSLNDKNLTAFRAKQLGFVFQFFNLLPRLTVLQNVALPMVYTAPKIDLERAKTLLTDLGLSQHFHHLPSQLSGGQQQRVAIARALINKPSLILADEPTGNVSQKQSHEILDTLESLNEQGQTVMLITHDPSVADRAKRVITIVDGTIQSDVRKHPLNTTSNSDMFLKKDVKRNKTRMSLRLLSRNINIALSSLMQNKVRSFLTMLGIIIGVFSVISMNGIGEGAKGYIQYEMRRMGSNMFRVQPHWPAGRGKRRPKFTHLNLKDIDFIQGHFKTDLVKLIVPTIDRPVTVLSGGLSKEVLVDGVTTDYQFLGANNPSEGRFFSDEENDTLAQVCLIGQTVKRYFFPDTNPLGASLNIFGKKFEIIGILEPKGSDWGSDLDAVVLIPLKTAQKRIFGTHNVRKIYFQALDENLMDQAMNEATRVLRESHRLGPLDSNDFKIKDYTQIKQTFETATGTMTTFIAVVALISLLVGGIGIMNIMLVSVSERTREIGLRKAIGAFKRDILTQFLVESVLIGLLGGSIGVLLAFAAGYVVRMYVGWDVYFTSISVVTAFLFSLVVGLVFGLYPANKASKLSPIKALRHD